MNFLALFFAGALLCNSAPHLVAGLQGQPFPTPFAQPSGKGNSSSAVNFLWGFANLVAALAIVSRYPLTIGLNGNFLALLAGIFVLGLLMSMRFGQVMRERAAK